MYLILIKVSQVRYDLSNRSEEMYYHIRIEELDATLNLFKPEVTIVIFIHYKPRIAVAILDL